MRVLLVEDDAMIAQAVSANLKDTGYAVDWVSRGSEVAAAVAAQAYDLLLLDLGLPGKDGLDVLAQIRNDGCTVPVLIVTARDDLHSRLNAWTAAQTTTSSNLSTWRNCKPVCAPYCADTADRRKRC